jgi:hypothetical protein
VTESAPTAARTDTTTGTWRFVRHYVEMDAAMYLPFVVLLVPFWTGAISGTTLSVAGHLLMLPAMLAVMLRRRAEYSAHHPRRVRRPATA